MGHSGSGSGSGAGCGDGKVSGGRDSFGDGGEVAAEVATISWNQVQIDTIIVFFEKGDPSVRKKVGTSSYGCFFSD